LTAILYVFINILIQNDVYYIGKYNEVFLDHLIMKHQRKHWQTEMSMSTNQ